MSPLRPVSFQLSSDSFSGHTLAAVNSQQSQIVRPSVGLSLKDAYSSIAPAPDLTSPERTAYLRVAPAWPAEKLHCSQRWPFSSPTGISASSALVRTVPCCGDSFYPVFSFLSRVIFPKIVVTWLCLWEEMSSVCSRHHLDKISPFLFFTSS